jgi:hypothetical protein
METFLLSPSTPMEVRATDPSDPKDEILLINMIKIYKSQEIFETEQIIYLNLSNGVFTLLRQAQQK